MFSEPLGPVPYMGYPNRSRSTSMRYIWLMYILLPSIMFIIIIGEALDQRTHIASTKKQSSFIDTQYKLSFIHIPKTAGSSVEIAALSQNIRYGKYVLTKQKKQYIYKNWVNKDIAPKCLRKCVPYHIPPRYYYKDVYYYDKSHYKLFCIVRNPFTRILSEYIYLHDNVLEDVLISAHCSVDAFNEQIKQLITDFKAHACHLNCHGLQQYEYVYDLNGNLICDYVLRFENLNKEFEDLMIQYGLNMTLMKSNERHHCNSIDGENELTINDISLENRQLIIDYYKNDFIHFNYSQIPNDVNK
eukprot:15857_1